MGTDDHPVTNLGAFTSAVVEDPVLADLVADLANRLAAGEAVDLEDYAARHPDRAEQLRLIWPAVRMMAALGGSAVGAEPTTRTDGSSIRRPGSRPSAITASCARSAGAAWASSTRPSRSPWAGAWR